MEQDEELKRIREKKLRELMKKAGETREKKSAPNKPIELTDAKFREMIQNHPLVAVDCWAPWCTPPTSLIPVDYGIVTISEVSIGDRVTHGGEVRRILKRHYRGKLIRIKGIGIPPFEVTPEHPILVSEMSKKNIGRKREFKEPHFVPAQELKEWSYSRGRGHALVIPRLKGTRDESTLSLSEYRRKATKGYVRTTELKLNEDLAWLFGLYVADGSSTVKPRGIVEFDLSRKETIDKACKVIREIGYKPSISKGHHCPRVRVGSYLLARCLRDWCGIKAHTKRIPQFILNHKSEKIVKSFIDGYLAGDGNYYSKRGIWNASTVSTSLAFQVQLLLARLGKLSAPFKREGREHELKGERIKGHDIYQIEIYDGPRRGSRLEVTQDYIFSPIRSIVEIPYEGWVYNLETENDTYLLSNTVVHNCAPCFMIAPILEEMARDYAGKILFGKLNMDENQKIAMQYEIMSIPTLLVFKKGKLVDRIIGAIPKKILEPKITRHL